MPFVTIPIKEIINESKDLKTLVFEHKLDAKPGQFIMLWIPRVNEKPFSISCHNESRFAITVSKVGPFTEELFKLKQGDFVGIKGPYGQGYNLKGKNIVLVGGGYGAASLAFLADSAKPQNINVNFIIGAKSKDYLLYEERMKQNGIKTSICTDDGSHGKKAFTTELLLDSLEKDKPDAVYACGPEVMLKKVVDICKEKNIYCEISLERMIKCGGGLCGNCCLDSTGWRVCQEGPVFNMEQVKQISEFGVYKRDKTGKKVSL